MQEYAGAKQRAVDVAERAAAAVEVHIFEASDKDRDAFVGVFPGDGVWVTDASHGRSAASSASSTVIVSMTTGVNVANDCYGASQAASSSMIQLPFQRLVGIDRGDSFCQHTARGFSRVMNTAGVTPPGAYGV